MNTKFKISKKALQWAVLFGFICSVFWSFADFDASCEELRHGCLRLHIVADSDSAADQEVKLKVRDAILEKSEEIFKADADLNGAISTAQSNLEAYNKIANEVLRENGFGYSAEALVGDAFFETRVYENFTLPSGEYKSLIIRLGEAKGKNWWCVIFPSVCLPTNGDTDFKNVVSDTADEAVRSPQKFVIRFKTVEIYEKLKKLLKGS